MNLLFLHRSGQVAFTLVEMLVAMAVLSIMLVFLGTLVASVSAVSSVGQQQAQDADNARAILDLMGRELEAGVNRADLTNWITTSNSPPTLAFYSQSTGSAVASVSSAVNYRGLSYIEYQLSQSATNSSLGRGDQAVLWTTATAGIPLGNSGANSNPTPTTSDILDGVVAFQICFLGPDGTYSSSYSTNSVAIGVSLALANSTSYSMLVSTSQLSTLSSALSSASSASTSYTEGTNSPKMAWENAVSTGALNGYPQQVKTGLRFYERFIVLPTPPL